MDFIPLSFSKAKNPGSMSNSAKLRSDFQRESSSSHTSKSIDSSQEKPNHGKKMSQKQTYNSKLRDRIRRYSKGKVSEH